MTEDQFDTRGNPVNLLRRETTPEAFERDVEYGMQVVRGFNTWSAGQQRTVRDKTVLEIGPGINLAATIGLKALGARKVYVADRWLPIWQDDYNPAFCRMMADRIRKEEPSWDASAFDRVAEQGFEAAVIPIESPVELLSERLPEKMDSIFSNAVLEHVADHAAAARSLRAVMNDDAIAFHQVDFRYHRDFSRPLDHLLMSQETYAADALACDYEYGCQLRPFELRRIFEAAGFKADWHPNDWVSGPYFDEFTSILRDSPSPYRETDVELLKETGGLYILKNA